MAPHSQALTRPSPQAEAVSGNTPAMTAKQMTDAPLRGRAGQRGGNRGLYTEIGREMPLTGRQAGNGGSERHQHFRFRLFMLKVYGRVVAGPKSLMASLTGDLPATPQPTPLPSSPTAHPLRCQTPWLPSFFSLRNLSSCCCCRLCLLKHTDMLSIIQINRRCVLIYALPS